MVYFNTQPGRGATISKHFKQIQMLWVSDNEIPENQVIEANIKKVSKIKSYNLASSISGKPGIYMRDNSCVCNVCLRGDILNCKETKCGEYKLFSLEKKREGIKLSWCRVIPNQVMRKIFNMILLLMI